MNKTLHSKSLHKVMTCASELALCTLRVRKHIKNISNQADFALVVAPTGLLFGAHRQSVSVEYSHFITFFKFILTVSDCVGQVPRPQQIRTFSPFTFVMQWQR